MNKLSFFLYLYSLFIFTTMAKDIDPNRQTLILDDEDSNPDTEDPYAGFPDLPQYSVWNQYPPNELFLSDPDWYDTFGIDMITQRRIFASSSKSRQVAQALELLEAHPNRGLDIMFKAAVKGKDHVISALLDIGVKAHPVPGSGDDETLVPLQAAAYNGHLKCVKVLIEKGGVHVDARDEIGGTALIRASWGKHPEIVQWLLEHGADPTIKQVSGVNALDFAAGGGNVQCAALLLEYQGKEWLMSQDAENSDNRRKMGVEVTPETLEAAVASKNTDMIKFVLEKGHYLTKDADGPEVWRGEKLTSEQRNDIQSALPRVRNLESLHLLLSLLWRPNEDTHRPNTYSFIRLPDNILEGVLEAMNAMVIQDEADAFKLLWTITTEELTMLSYKGETFTKAAFVNDLLHAGAKAGSVDCVRVILEMSDADINALGFKMVSHLYRAAIDNRLEIVRYLVENHKPDLHQASGLYANGPTALFGAVEGGNQEIVKLILQHGGPLESPVEDIVKAGGPMKVIVKAAKEYRAPVTIEIHEDSDVQEVRKSFSSVVLDLDQNDVSWLNNLEIRKSDEELKVDDAQNRELRLKI
jgi:ankyrin repeat protein